MTLGRGDARGALAAYRDFGAAYAAEAERLRRQALA